MGGVRVRVGVGVGVRAGVERLLLLLPARLKALALLRVDLLVGEIDLGAECDDHVE